MKIENSKDLLNYMNDTWTVYASNTKTGNRLEFNGRGSFRIVNKNKTFFTPSYDDAVNYFNMIEGN